MSFPHLPHSVKLHHCLCVARPPTSSPISSSLIPLLSTFSIITSIHRGSLLITKLVLFAISKYSYHITLVHRKPTNHTVQHKYPLPSSQYYTSLSSPLETNARIAHSPHPFHHPRFHRPQSHFGSHLRAICSACPIGTP